MINVLWVSLFVFLLGTATFGIVSIGSGKPYWRFGMGFGLGIAIIFPLAGVVMPSISSWSFPLILFAGVPLILIGLVYIIVFAVFLGVIFYGRKRWDKDSGKEKIEYNI